MVGYIEQKEAFVSGLSGTSKFEVAFAIVAVIAYVRMHMPNPNKSTQSVTHAGALFDDDPPCGDCLITCGVICLWY